MRKKQKKSEKKMLVFDLIMRKSKNEKVSVWSGQRGTYLFRKLDRSAIKKPVSQVFLNRKYLTGIFKTKNLNVFSGDLLIGEKKTYLLFRIISQDKIEIMEKIE